ncbi:unnamed protein product [Linum tenue]|uniref:Late embryogenesis abundant protein LEA-2 subgroup domain-containing protein n=1 Tax=Linum tenue TaxID=586396 RepID=A0AAV0JR24_9ROSI|nr:unnamed protein product [Linum tenue]CAI0412216.1 unnamed protein product [Linum tenue]
MCNVNGKPCWVTAALTLLIVLIVVSTTLAALALTVFRPRDPTFTIELVGLPAVRLEDIVPARNVTVTVVIGISNGNYASFAWRDFTASIRLNGTARDFTASIRLNGTAVGEVTIRGGRVVQRTNNMNVTAAPTFEPAKLLLPPFNLPSVIAALRGGGLHFTCSVTVFGEVKAFGVVSLPGVRGSISIDCVGSMYVDGIFFHREGGFFGGQASCWTAKKRLLLLSGK